jgi:hypothetical protein
MTHGPQWESERSEFVKRAKKSIITELTERLMDETGEDGAEDRLRRMQIALRKLRF